MTTSHSNNSNFMRTCVSLCAVHIFLTNEPALSVWKCTLRCVDSANVSTFVSNTCDWYQLVSKLEMCMCACAPVDNINWLLSSFLSIQIEFIRNNISHNATTLNRMIVYICCAYSSTAIIICFMATMQVLHHSACVYCLQTRQATFESSQSNYLHTFIMLNNQHSIDATKCSR